MEANVPAARAVRFVPESGQPLRPRDRLPQTADAIRDRAAAACEMFVRRASARAAAAIARGQCDPPDAGGCARRPRHGRGDRDALTKAPATGQARTKVARGLRWAIRDPAPARTAPSAPRAAAAADPLHAPDAAIARWRTLIARLRRRQAEPPAHPRCGCPNAETYGRDFQRASA